MASKKESEQELQAQAEEKVAKLHRRFSTMKLVPEEVVASEELPISPALEFDDTDDEPLPPLTKPKAEEVTKTPEPVKPEQRPTAGSKEKKSDDLGAAGFLLSGMVPKTSEPSKKEDEPKKKVTTDVEKKPEDKSKATASDKVESGDKTPAEPAIQSTAAADEPEPTSEEPKPSIQSEVPQPPSQPAQKSEDEESDAKEGGKSGVFAKAKSLLATITKKDKK